jgi:hypothetical protein
MTHRNNIELVKNVTRILMNHHLTGRALEDGCTDGYDVEYVCLAQDIIAEVDTFAEDGKGD